MKKLKSILFVTALSALLCSCSNTNNDESNPTTNNTINDVVENQNTSSTLEIALGEWVCVAQSYNDFIQIADDICLSSNINIYYEDNKYKADFNHSIENSELEIYGKSLTEVSGPLYEGCSNQDWYCEYKNGEGFYSKSYGLTLLDNETLEVLETEVYRYEDESEEDNTYYTHYYFKKADSDLEAAIYSFRYPEEIIVSNVKEFYNALGSNRKIILKSGTYNFSELTDADKNNENVNWRYGYVYNDDSEADYDFIYYNEQQAYCFNLYNLIIEGEDGGEVHICTEDSHVAPIAFGDCNYITLKNLKVGHIVEPGFCSGSVIYLDNTYNCDIENCRLYGCGTYGIEAIGCSSIDVNKCDIYECSYGLISISNCNSIYFNNCTLRDSKEFAMFELFESSSIGFKNCTIKNNNSSSNNNPFIKAISCYDDIIFENCTFKDNKYTELYEGEVIFKDCTM